MSEPKPCPFCGHVGLDFREGSTFRWIVADCAGCGASVGETRIQTLGDGTKEEWMAEAQKDAIAAWNRRAALAAQPGAVPPGDVEAARQLLSDAMGTDLLSGDRKVVNSDRAAVYRLLSEAFTLLTPDLAAPTEAKPAQDAVDAVIVDAYAFPTADLYADEIKIQRTRQIEGPALWKVMDKGNCLNKSGEWEWEPMPSSRDDEFLARCRFDTADEAIRAAISAKKVGAA